MTISKEEARAMAAATYNAASDHYDQPALSFWDHYGRRTIERLSLQPGAYVLDVCSGSGTIDQLDPEARERIRRSRSPAWPRAAASHRSINTAITGSAARCVLRKLSFLAYV